MPLTTEEKYYEVPKLNSVEEFDAFLKSIDAGEVEPAGSFTLVRLDEDPQEGLGDVILDPADERCAPWKS